MIKRLCLLFIAVLGCFSGEVYAQKAVGVVILPFEVHAKAELSYLQQEIPKALSNQLEQEGAKVLVLDEDSLPSWKQQIKNIAQLREIGLQTGAQYVLWGSLTWIGQNFSLDVKLISSGDEEKPALFSKDGEGVENLPTSVKEITKDISLVIFKREKIVDVLIEGNNRIEADAIRRLIKAQPGDIYNQNSLSQDLKAVYDMGYFDDIRIEAQTRPDGKIVIFKVKEKPTVRNIRFKGKIRAYEEEELREVLTVRTGSILNLYKINNDIARIKEMYNEKNYHNAKVDYKIIEQKKNQADVEFYIEEGKKLHVTKIRFKGNRAFSDDDLKDLMTTSEENIFSWFTDAGDLIFQNLTRDVAQIQAFYRNNGYIQARVGEPQIEYKEDGVEITITVVEGPQFKVGKVKISGDMILPEQQLLEKIKIHKEEYYNREVLRNDVLALDDLYANEGYANVDVSPRITQHEEDLSVDIDIVIDKGKLVYFENIIIGGNTKTRDKVIRRELRVYEQELFSADRLRRSIRNLNRLDYFADVQVNTAAGSADDKKILKVDVTEKSTGTVQFGAGYGNVENLFGAASISERNLFGRGQTLSLDVKLGSKTQQYGIHFVEPWLFDIPLTAGIRLYNWGYEYDFYTKDSIGGSLSFSYPILDYTRGSIGYIYDVADVTDVSEDAAASIKQLEGTNSKSSVTTTLAYDSRDSNFFPTTGSYHKIALEYAGVGGDIGFVKTIGETTWYHNLFWKTVGVAHAKGAFVESISDKLLPDYELFYMGGINSLRGFDREDLAPRDENGDPIGGDKYAQLNLELRAPLVEEIGMYAVLFFDIGNVYGEGESIDFGDLRMSAGPGIMWMSPMGPVNLYYGYILDPEDTDHARGDWEFSLATSF